MRPKIYTGGHFGRDRCSSGTIPRHRHSFGYICLVLRGNFVEAGDVGRFRLAPGHALVHRPFEAHLDHFGRSSADVLNLPFAENLEEGLIEVDDPDTIAREAERDPALAAGLLASMSRRTEGEKDWPDLLAEALRRDSALSLAKWASRQRLAPATVSRGFRQVYGVSPVRFRAEARARRACHALAGGPARPAAIAAELGFADQAHMSRSVREVAGFPPAQLRLQRQTRSILL